MKQYQKPESCILESSPWMFICDSLTGSSGEDFTESEDITWNL